jgi:hypothetical protein
MPKILGGERAADADYLDSCRIKRNKVEYDYVGGASEADARELVSFVEELRREVLEWLREKHAKLQ